MHYDEKPIRKEACFHWGRRAPFEDVFWQTHTKRTRFSVRRRAPILTWTLIHRCSHSAYRSWTRLNPTWLIIIMIQGLFPIRTQGSRCSVTPDFKTIQKDACLNLQRSAFLRTWTQLNRPIKGLYNERHACIQEGRLLALLLIHTVIKHLYPIQTGPYYHSGAPFLIRRWILIVYMQSLMDHPQINNSDRKS